MKGERNITRMDYGRTHGWWVRVYRGRGADKICFSKHFSDGVWGGKRKALEAARKWRAQTIRQLPSTRPGGSRTPRRAPVRRRPPHAGEPSPCW